MNDTAEEKNLADSVQFSIGLDTVISTEVEYDNEGGMVGRAPITLGQMVAGLVAENITRQITSEMRREYTAPIRDRVNKIADQIVEEKLRDVLSRETVPTDPYGNSKGEPTSLAEVIVKRADAWMKQESGDNYRSGGRKTNIARLIDDAVGAAFQRELQTEVKRAKDAAVKAVADNAGAAMTDILRKAVQS